MTKCNQCNGSGIATYYRADGLAIDYLCPDCKTTKPMTNYDRIMRDMTVEQMAELLVEPLEEADSGMVFYHTSTGGSYDYDDAVKAEIEWLKKECDA